MYFPVLRLKYVLRFWWLFVRLSVLGPEQGQHSPGLRPEAKATKTGVNCEWSIAAKCVANMKAMDSFHCTHLTYVPLIRTFHPEFKMAAHWSSCHVTVPCLHVKWYIIGAHTGPMSYFPQSGAQISNSLGTGVGTFRGGVRVHPIMPQGVVYSQPWWIYHLQEQKQKPNPKSTPKPCAHVEIWEDWTGESNTVKLPTSLSEVKAVW